MKTFASKVPDKAAMQRNITLLAALQIFFSLQFHQPIFTLFLLAKGLTMQEFFLLQSIGGIATLLMEIPTGMFSDRVSRKTTLLVAYLIFLPTTLLMILSDSFSVLLAASVLGGVGAAFASGTDGAMFYDSLKALKKEKENKIISGRISWYCSWAWALSALVGGGLAWWNLSYAWWAWFVSLLPCLLVVLLLKEPPIHRTQTRSESFITHLHESYRKGLRGRAGYFVLYTVTVWLFFSIGYWLWQPYLKLIEVPFLWFGVLYAALNVIGGLASKHADGIERRLGMRGSLLLIPLLLATAFFMESQAILLFGAVFLSLQSIAGGFFATVTNDYINAVIPSERRATILSLKNMLSSVLFSVLSPIVGLYMDVFDLRMTLLLLSGSLSILALVLWRLMPMDRSTQ